MHIYGVVFVKGKISHENISSDYDNTDKDNMPFKVIYTLKTIETLV